jgi:hypothetical protein
MCSYKSMDASSLVIWIGHCSNLSDLVSRVPTQNTGGGVACTASCKVGYSLHSGLSRDSMIRF